VVAVAAVVGVAGAVVDLAQLPRKRPVIITTVKTINRNFLNTFTLL
jgi:hypothetical protein